MPHTHRTFSSRILLIILLLTVSFVAAQESYMIRALEVRGNNVYDDQYVFERVSSKIGQILDPAAIAADIERLFDQGVFNDVKVYFEPYTDGIKLIYVVEERATIGRVSYIGVEDIDEDKVSEAINRWVTSGEPLNPSALNEVELAVKTLAREEGLIRCRVTPELSESADELTDIKFVIEEGSEIWIGHIDFEGNTTYSDWEIRNLFMIISEDEFWNSESFEEKTLEEDLASIVTGYNNGGYLNARVEGYELNFSDDDEEVDILITIHEGERFYFGGVNWEGNLLLSDRQIERSLTMAPGEVFNQSLYESALATVQDDYWEYGYVFMQVDEQKDIDEATNVINYHWVIAEGEPATVGELKIVGNSYTKDKVIRREFTIYPGDVFNGKAFRRSLERVFNLQYFENVVPDWTVDTENRVINLTVRVIEKEGTTKISVGAGFSTRDGFSGNFSIGWINFDTEALPEFWRAKGGGQSLTLSAELGATVSNFSVSFMEPWFLDTSTTIGAGAYHNTSRTYFDYEQVKFGFYGILGRPIGADSRWQLRYDYVENTINPDDDASEATIENAGTTLTSSVTLSLSRDTRDNYFFPTDGSRQHVSFELAGGIFGGDVDFYKIQSYATNYFPAFWESALAMRVNAGYIAPYADTETVPVYERFYVGGNDVRGYDDFTLSPRDSNGKLEGGNFNFYTNFELRYPIVENMIFAFLFFDAGYAWTDINKLDFNDLAHGYGIGARLDIPMIGLLGFDYGWSSTLADGRLHFSIANTF